ncbi:MAG: DUF2314 domain-containing protein [Gemmataceae bacterium]
MSFRSVTWGLIGLMMLAGCGKKPIEDKVILVSSSDSKMNAAMEKARQTIQTFIQELKSPKTGQSGFSVKVGLTENGKTEHMWLAPVEFDGKKFHGVINNDPEFLKTYKLGQKIDVELSNISDWMYIENRVLMGGYTIRVLRDMMPAKERAEFDQAMPFQIR